MCCIQYINSKSKWAFLFLFQNEQVNVDNGIAYRGSIVFSVCFCWSNPHTTQIFSSTFKDPLSNAKEQRMGICYSSMPEMVQKLICIVQDGQRIQQSKQAWTTFVNFNAETSNRATMKWLIQQWFLVNFKCFQLLIQ